MTKEMLKKVFEEKKIETEKWLTLTNIDYIKLMDGIFVIPNIEHCRFLFTKKYDLLIQYSESYKIGERLLGLQSLSGNGRIITFSDHHFLKTFRKPKSGDIFIVWDDSDIIFQAYITNAINSFNGFVVELNRSINLKQNCKIGFYDPEKLNGEELEKDNINFLKFIPLINGKKSEYGFYTQKIKLSQIENIIGKAEI